MISKKTKLIIKEIDKNRRIKEVCKELREEEYEKEAKIMDKYRICPQCGAKVKKKFFLEGLFIINKTLYQCEKCKLKRIHVRYSAGMDY